LVQQPLYPQQASGQVLLDLMLPDSQYRPASPAQLGTIAPVPNLILSDLAFPLVLQLVAPSRKTPPMPKIAIDKDDQS
jgi:hypothetical protein